MYKGCLAFFTNLKHPFVICVDICCCCCCCCLQSFLIEISAIIAAKKDAEGDGFLVDKIVDKTGAKGTGGFCIKSTVYAKFIRISTAPVDGGWGLPCGQDRGQDQITGPRCVGAMGAANQFNFQHAVKITSER
jgi:hypothetical protein